MTELNQIYKCNICGNIVEITHSGVGDLVCSGQAMTLQEENAVDAAYEKHVPVIEKKEEGGIKVKVGEVPHPMTEEHYIEWIEKIYNGKVIRKHLKPGEVAEVDFCGKGDDMIVRAYCNLHGLWKNA